MNNTIPRKYEVVFENGKKIITKAYDAVDAIAQACVSYQGTFSTLEEVPPVYHIEAYENKISDFVTEQIKSLMITGGEE